MTIKIKIPLRNKIFSCETLWLNELSYNTGEIANIPWFGSRYRYKDIVEFDCQTMQAVRVIQRSGYTMSRFFGYKGSFAEAMAKLESKGYVVEGVKPGVLSATKRRDTRQKIKNTAIALTDTICLDSM